VKYQLTEDWFNWAPPVWEKLHDMLPAHRKFLEIGSYEGRSMIWIAENMSDKQNSCEIYCIDTWGGGEEHGKHDMQAVEARFDHNRLAVMDSNANVDVFKRKGLSVTHLAALAGAQFDFIYIDGSHIARDVLTDACMAWPLLKPGGVMVFDDYLWGEPRDSLHRPKVAVDAFINIFAEQLEIAHIGYQAAIKKKGG